MLRLAPGDIKRKHRRSTKKKWKESREESGNIAVSFGYAFNMHSHSASSQFTLVMRYTIVS